MFDTASNNVLIHFYHSQHFSAILYYFGFSVGSDQTGWALLPTGINVSWMLMNLSQVYWDIICNHVNVLKLIDERMNEKKYYFIGNTSSTA